MLESNSFQNNGDPLSQPLEPGSMKKKRDEYLVEIRSRRREQLLNTKRMRNLNEDTNVLEFNFPQQVEEEEYQKEYTEYTSLKEHIDKCLGRTYEIDQFQELYEAIYSEDKFMRHYGMIGMRKILSLPDRSPIQVAVDMNLIPKLIEFMKSPKNSQMQLEATWALTNIAAGSSDQTESVIQQGAIPVLVQLLDSPRLEVIEQAVWAIGNIAGDCATFRDMLLREDVMEPMNRVIMDGLDCKNDPLIKHGTWAMSNLCRGTPLPKFSLVKTAIPTLSKVIQEQVDYEVLSDAFWAMAHLSDGDEDRIEIVLQTGIASALARLLDVPYVSIVVPLLRVMGNIATSNDDHIECLLEYPNIVEKLYKLLTHEKKTVRRETCWVLSNIAAGRADQIAHIFAKPEYIAALIKVTLSDNMEVRKEAGWTLANATNGGESNQIIYFVRNGFLDCFCSLLESTDVELLEVALEGIYNILDTGALIAHEENTENKLLILFESKGAVGKIEKLQHHEDNKVYRLALKILTKHFEVDEFI